MIHFQSTILLINKGARDNYDFDDVDLAAAIDFSAPCLLLT